MTLSAGTKLGPYEIQAAVGAGGMGEVYKARDTRLDRIVAIKVLPAGLANDPDRRERFHREAHAVAALNHPHICTLYDVGHQDGVDFLVMEYLEGETLAAQLAGRGVTRVAPASQDVRGAGVSGLPMPIADVLRYAVEIADALDAAHRQHIVHRDLKPGNVMLTKTGAKLLDFGLAKLRAAETGAVAGASALPTMSAPLTGQGTILGTLQYMAPEQVEGKEADARTDIFAFGEIVYEMATGKRAFEGKSHASLIAAILEHDPPPIAASQPLTPPALDRIVKTCLAKDPDERWQSARDLLRELKWVADASSQAGASAPLEGARTSARHRTTMLWAVGVLASFIAGAALVWTFRPPATETSGVTRLEVGVQPAERLGARRRAGFPVDMRTAGGAVTAFALSPDGRSLAFVGHTGKTQQLFLRPLDRDVATPIPGTQGAEGPFFSPDGLWIAFWSDGKLRKVPIKGGPTVAICDWQNMPSFGASWGANGTIVFARGYQSGLWNVSSDGGDPQELTKRQPGEFSHRLPHFLPGGEALLFTVRTRGWTWGDEQIVVQSLRDGTRKTLVQGADARYVSSGHLVYLQLGTLMAVPFNLAKLEIAGAPVAMVDDVAQAVNENNTSLASGAGQVDVSDSGVLVYARGGVAPRQRTTLAWIDRRGAVTTLPMEPADYRAPRVSPDGERIVVRIWETTKTNLWIYDVTRGTLSRLQSESEDAWPIWSRDGRELMFQSARQGAGTLARRRADGVGPSASIGTTGAISVLPTSLSPDGRVLAFLRLDPATGWDVWTHVLGEPGASPQPLIRTTSSDSNAEFSPDGGWLAYQSNESGRDEVYLQPYPGPGSRLQVSTQGGSSPAWAPNGRELFYVGPAEKPDKSRMMAVDVTPGPPLKAGLPRTLFEYDSAILTASPSRPYDVAPDAQRFLIFVWAGEDPDRPVTHLNVVLNWFEELKGRVSGNR